MMSERCIPYGQNFTVNVREKTKDLVCIVDVVFGEVGGAPAGDWIADVLRCADDCCENDQEQNGVAVVQAVNHVVVVA